MKACAYPPCVRRSEQKKSRAYGNQNGRSKSVSRNELGRSLRSGLVIGAADGGRTRITGWGWRLGNCYKARDYKTMHISHAARAVHAVLRLCADFAVKLADGCPYATCIGKAEDVLVGVAQSAKPEMGLCKGCRSWEPDWDWQWQRKWTTSRTRNKATMPGCYRHAPTATQAPPCILASGLSVPTRGLNRKLPQWGSLRTSRVLDGGPVQMLFFQVALGYPATQVVRQAQRRRLLVRRGR